MSCTQDVGYNGQTIRQCRLFNGGFSAALDIVYDFAIMSALLMVGTIIRSKVKPIQNLYIPASLIAGFLGLLLGKQFLNILPFSDSISDYPGILVATGVILLRLTDPDFKTGALEDMGIVWLFLNIMDMLYVSFAPMFVISGQGALFGVVLVLISVVALVMVRRLYLSRGAAVNP